MNTESMEMVIPEIIRAYQSGLSPKEMIDEVYRRIDAVGDDGIFLLLRDKAEVYSDADKLNIADLAASAMPLWGVPFVIKDNIDAAGITTTAGCDAWAYVAREDAFAVAALRRAGALLIGKTNLDQFATGLVGVRSFHPPPLNAIDTCLVPGGSSSGSAVAVAHAMVAFSLGTDTAGSGRVPAALNNIVGLKPTLGTVSASGVVPACRTLDTVSVFATTVRDAFCVYKTMAQYDPEDAYSCVAGDLGLRPLKPVFSVAIPNEDSIKFAGDDVQRAAFAATVADLEKAGATIQPVDFSDFYDIAQMLYEGAWVAERFTVLESLLDENPDAVFPVTRQIVEAGRSLSAADTFRGFYRLQELRRKVEPLLQKIDYLCVPTIPTPVTLADIEADPVTPNSMLGTYTNFVNLLNLCALAVPCGTREDGLPASVTLIANPGCDADLAVLAERIESRQPRDPAAAEQALPNSASPNSTLPEPLCVPGEIALAVCGAHMSGLSLNHQLTDLGGRFMQATTTLPNYELYALSGAVPAKPGMLRVAKGGAAVPLEVWALPVKKLGDFMAQVKTPLSIGSVELADGSLVAGFLVEGYVTDRCEQIDAAEGWRGYLANKN